MQSGSTQDQALTGKLAGFRVCQEIGSLVPRASLATKMDVPIGLNPPHCLQPPQATTSEDKMTLSLWRADSERCQRSFPPLPVLVKKEAITRRLHSDTFGPGQIIPPARQAQESLGHSPPACWERAEDSRAGRMLCFSFAHLWLLISNARGGVGGLGALSETSYLTLFSFSPSFFSFCLVF